MTPRALTASPSRQSCPCSCGWARGRSRIHCAQRCARRRIPRTCCPRGCSHEISHRAERACRSWAGRPPACRRPRSSTAWKLIEQIVGHVATTGNVSVEAQLDPIGQREVHAKVTAVLRGDRQSLAVQRRTHFAQRNAEVVSLDLVVLIGVAAVDLEPLPGEDAGRNLDALVAHLVDVDRARVGECNPNAPSISWLNRISSLTSRR